MRFCRKNRDNASRARHDRRPNKLPPGENSSSPVTSLRKGPFRFRHPRFTVNFPRSSAFAMVTNCRSVPPVSSVFVMRKTAGGVGSELDIPAFRAPFRTGVTKHSLRRSPKQSASRTSLLRHRATRRRPVPFHISRESFDARARIQGASREYRSDRGGR